MGKAVLVGSQVIAGIAEFQDSQDKMVSQVSADILAIAEFLDILDQVFLALVVSQELVVFLVFQESQVTLVLVLAVFLVSLDFLAFLGIAVFQELADTQEAVYLVTQAIQVVVYLDFLEHLALADIAE